MASNLTRNWTHFIPFTSLWLRQLPLILYVGLFWSIELIEIIWFNCKSSKDFLNVCLFLNELRQVNTKLSALYVKICMNNKWLCRSEIIIYITEKYKHMHIFATVNRAVKDFKRNKTIKQPIVKFPRTAWYCKCVAWKFEQSNKESICWGVYRCLIYSHNATPLLHLGFIYVPLGPPFTNMV